MRKATPAVTAVAILFATNAAPAQSIGASAERFAEQIEPARQVLSERVTVTATMPKITKRDWTRTTIGAAITGLSVFAPDVGAGSSTRRKWAGWGVKAALAFAGTFVNLILSDVEDVERMAEARVRDVAARGGDISGLQPPTEEARALADRAIDAARKRAQGMAIVSVPQLQLLPQPEAVPTEDRQAPGGEEFKALFVRELLIEATRLSQSE